MTKWGQKWLSVNKNFFGKERKEGRKVGTKKEKKEGTKKERKEGRK